MRLKEVKYSIYLAVIFNKGEQKDLFCSIKKNFSNKKLLHNSIRLEKFKRRERFYRRKEFSPIVKLKWGAVYGCNKGRDDLSGTRTSQ